MDKNVMQISEKRPRAITVDGKDGATASLEFNDAMNCYERWPSPTAIISDGPYGLGKYPGEPKTPENLGKWYEPHIKLWSECSLPSTTLWFWCTEQGWADVHSVLKSHGWVYRAAHIWDKGIGHVAGNCNGDTIRSFPVVTEVCVQYVRDVRITAEDGRELSIKEWLRHEWRRSGLPLCKTNEACGVKNAATRKYFTQCHLWYFPPLNKMMQLAEYAEKFGNKTSRPYFSLDGVSPLTKEKWSGMRAKWNHTHGITNVWQEPAVRGVERIKQNGKLKSLHANQKPLKLITQTILASTDSGDVVWEPFGGMCSGLISALHHNRRGYGAELLPEYYRVASERLLSESLGRDSIAYNKTKRTNTERT